MKLCDQVCTIEQGKRLLELGVTAPAVFWWGPVKSGSHGSTPQLGWSSDSVAPAYTVAELGIMLPPHEWSMYTEKQEYKWVTGFIIGNGTAYCHSEINGVPYGAWKTEAEARAQVLIHQIESRTTNFDEIVKRVEI